MKGGAEIHEGIEEGGELTTSRSPFVFVIELKRDSYTQQETRSRA
jgi:hypothetical protein